MMEEKYFIIPYYCILHSFNGFLIKNSPKIIILYGYFTFFCNKNVGHVIRKTHLGCIFQAFRKLGVCLSTVICHKIALGQKGMLWSYMEFDSMISTISISSSFQM